MSNKARKREDIEEQYKWKLEDIYPNEQLWEDDFKLARIYISKIGELEGSLSSSASSLLKALQLADELERKIDKIYVYARLHRDEDNSKQKYQALSDRAESLAVLASSASSFVIPEILSIDKDTIKSFLAEDRELAVYEHFFAELWRQEVHILSPQEERLMAMTADISMASGNIFTMLNNADIKFPFIKDENGEEIEITKGRYGSLMESSDRRVRKDAFSGLYSSYHKLINTVGTSLSSSVKKDIFYARARKYNSALESSLDQDNVALEVYDNLIDSVHTNMKHMYRYMELRKKMLGLNELHMYDIYTPLVKEYKLEIPYEKGREIVINALQPLGSDYIEVLKKGIESGWIDVYENEGKTSGAFSGGCYDTNPYVLMNYDNKLDDVFTLAHELGHSMHSYYSNKKQPFVYSQYAIFVAEVASTVNESLLIDYMLKNSSDKQEKIYLINHYLEQFRGTVYRQTMFAEFEKIIHSKSEQGEALTPESLSEIYLSLNKLYYGPELVQDDEIKLEWARIPHFYSAFYVYKYATGFSAATALKQQILKEGKTAVDRYLAFLKTGSSNYPINLLQAAGVDLTTPAPVDNALSYFAELLDEMEKLLQ